MIEVEIFPWNPKNKLSLTKNTPIHPLFYNEEGIPYIRRLSGVHQVNIIHTCRYVLSFAY